MTINHEAALHYASLGYRVFPCKPDGKEPLTPHGFKDATTDEVQIDEWWTQWPTANVAIATEGMIVIDVDGADNPWPPDPDFAELIGRAPMAITPRGGVHYIYGDTDREYRNTTGTIADKVDTRGVGGYILVAPSRVNGKPYKWINNIDDVPFDELPKPPDPVRNILDAACRRKPLPKTVNENSDITENSIKEGGRNDWLTKMAGGMRRFNFSESALYAALCEENEARCDPPLPEADVRKIARSVARYEPDGGAVARTLEPIIEAPPSVALDEHKPAPESMLRIPGFISEYMDYTMSVAHVPNQALSFAGAASMMATLTGRSVRDKGGTRTNAYIVALASSGAGKQMPRTVNNRFAYTVGIRDRIGDSFASAEGLQDAIMDTPTMLFQIDEFDGMLQAANKAIDGRGDSLISETLRMYTSSATTYMIRKLAKRKGEPSPTQFVEQPHLTIFATAVPKFFYGAMTPKLLTNGMFPRFTIIENSCDRQMGDPEDTEAPFPERLIEIARLWIEDTRHIVGDGTIIEPRVVPIDKVALEKLTEYRRIEFEMSRKYNELNENDPIAGSVWARVIEQTKKYALLYACSESFNKPQITETAIDWAWNFCHHQTQRMLYMAHTHCGGGEGEADVERVLGIIRKYGGTIKHSDLMRASRLRANELKPIIDTLVQRDVVESLDAASSGRDARGRKTIVYRSR